MAAYRRVYDSRHLQADCQEPGSTPEPYARQSSAGYLYLFTRQMQGMKRPHAHPALSQSLCSTQYTMHTLMKCVLLSAVKDRLNKKLCYRRGTARRATSVDIVSTVETSQGCSPKKEVGTPETRLRRQLHRILILLY